MDNVISFTPSELVAFITAIGGAIVTVGAVVALIVKLVNRLKAPEKEQNDRITACEDRLTAVEEQNKIFTQYFINDNNRFNAIESSTKIIISTLRALLKHAINDSDTEQLKEADKELDEYLITK